MAPDKSTAERSGNLDETDYSACDGDPPGISPESTAKLLALDEIISTRGSSLSATAACSTTARELPQRSLTRYRPSGTALSREERCPVFTDVGHLDPASVTRSTATAEGGRFALDNYRHALTMGATAGPTPSALRRSTRTPCVLPTRSMTTRSAFGRRGRARRPGERDAGRALERARHLAYLAWRGRVADHHQGTGAAGAAAHRWLDSAESGGQVRVF
jgi:hypothetical protein